MTLTLNLTLALIWVFMTGGLTAANFVLGWVIGYTILLFIRSPASLPRYFVKSRLLVLFAAFFLKELVLSSLRIAWDVLTPRHFARPGIVAFPLAARTDLEITLLANLITLTPGTLSVAVSEDRQTLFIHAMYIDDPESVRAEIKNGFERRVLELLR